MVLSGGTGHSLALSGGTGRSLALSGGTGALWSCQEEQAALWSCQEEQAALWSCQERGRSLALSRGTGRSLALSEGKGRFMALSEGTGRSLALSGGTERSLALSGGTVRSEPLDQSLRGSTRCCLLRLNARLLAGPLLPACRHRAGSADALAACSNGQGPGNSARRLNNVKWQVKMLYSGSGPLPLIQPSDKIYKKWVNCMLFI